MLEDFEAGKSIAEQMDAADPLRRFRERFNLPSDSDGRPAIYFCGNSLGPQLKSARALVDRELDAWARLAVEGHFKGAHPWYTYNERLREGAAHLIGARPGEVVCMNALTVNLHLMLATFFQPSGARTRILIEEPTFPSDLYAVVSQLQHHGLDPAEHLLTVQPRTGEHHLREENIESLLQERGSEIAVVMLNAVHFLTGQWLDVARLTRAAQAQGCVAGWDLAHAAGNVPLQMHDSNADFAIFCTYKYVCAGPGAVGACFVHERHGIRPELPRLAGWWGNDPKTRFRMQLQPEFVPLPGAEGWQISNPPVLALAPLQACFEVFHEAGLTALREKSMRLTGYLESLLDQLPGGFEILTPRDPQRRGCQLSLRIHEGGREVLQRLLQVGVMCDFREPHVLRVAPAPLYNSFLDVWEFVQRFRTCLSRG